MNLEPLRPCSLWFEANKSILCVVKILFLCAEVAPFVSVGGLSQVMYFLPKELRKRKHDVRMFTPRYAAMDESGKKKIWKLKPLISPFEIPINGNLQETISCKLEYAPETTLTPTTYFLVNEEYFSLRANLFGYKDDHVRFALLSKAALEWLLYQKKHDFWMPDVIHCNGWHTGYFIEMARRDKRYKEVLKNIPIVLTIHNFHYQGNYDFRFQKIRDDGSKVLEHLLSPKMQKQNPLLRGILYADGVNTVSPTHALEVLTPEYAEGLDEILTANRGKLGGILNGLDTKEFNPMTDPIIDVNFSSTSFTQERAKNKANLQKLFFLEVNERRPLFVSIGRINSQKGWDLTLEVLPHLFAVRPEVQLIILGNGDDNYRHQMLELQERFPDNLAIHLQSDFRLPRKLFAGGDCLLLPSLFEPGGIVALEGLRYGCVPLVRRTGGLNDIVTDFNFETKEGNGFSFSGRDPWGLFASMIHVIDAFSHRTLWKSVVKNALDSDFSWKYSAKEYEMWYTKVIEQRKRAASLTPHPAYLAEKK